MQQNLNYILFPSSCIVGAIPLSTLYLRLPSLYQDFVLSFVFIRQWVNRE